MIPCISAATAVLGDVETKHPDEDNDTRISDRIVTDTNENSLTSESLHNLVGKADKIREDEEEVEQSSESLTLEITNLTSEREQFQWAYADFSDLPLITNEDNIFTSLESTEKITVSSQVPIPNSPDREQQQYLGLTSLDLPPTSPVSPLSLNSCQFEIQIRPNNGHASQIQHAAQSFPMDLIENLELLDSEEYLQKIEQMGMAAVWDIHNEEDLSCFQDNLSFLNTLHADFAMDKQAIYSDGDICEGLQQMTTLLENSVKNMNVENDLRSNVTNSQVHCGSSGHNVQEKQTSATMGCYINHPDISTAVNKEGQYSSRGTWTVSEQGNVSSHVSQEHDLLDRTQLKNCKPHLCHYNYAPSEVNEPYYMQTDEEKKIMDAGSTLNPNLTRSNPANLISSIAHCYGFEVPLKANSDCIGDWSTFSNDSGRQSGPCFEGVAQSFPAPHENPHPHPVSTPPLNDDWLFSNIATEVDFNSMVESHGHAFC